MMKKTELLLLLNAFAITLWAAPAMKTAVTVTGSDGKPVEVFTRGDENCHWYENVQGEEMTRLSDGTFTVLSDKARSIRKAKRKVTRLDNATQNLPTTGSPKIPVILVQFKDVQFSSSDPVSTYNTRFNTATKGVKQYLTDMSAGAFTPEFEIFGPVTLPGNQANYGQNTAEGKDIYAGRFARDAVRYATTQTSINLPDYDLDGNGEVDFIYLVYAGEGEATAGASCPDAIWPHKSSLTEQNIALVKVQDVYFNNYACSNELINGRMDGIGLIVHELSHALGLPDFHSTGASNDMYCMDEWSVMDYGCYLNHATTPCGYTAHERDLLGWVEFMPLSKMCSFTLKTIDNGGQPAKITNEANPNEYYILENRQNTGWDTYLPSHGMMITHIDYDDTAWKTNAVNVDPNHPRMTIVPADNDLSFETNSGDLWPNGGLATDFNDTSTPAAFTYTGNILEKPVEQITENDGEITFYYDNGADRPILGFMTNVTDRSFKVNWSECNGWQSYSVRIWEATPRDTALVASEDFSTLVADANDISGKLNAYLSSTGWTGNNLYAEDGAMRLGSIGNVGTIISPVFDGSKVDGTVTVMLNAKSYGIDSDVTLRVELIHANGTTAQTFTLNAAGQDIVYVFTDIPDGCRLKVSTIAARKRALITKIEILNGDFTDEYSTPQRVERSEVDGVITFDDIHDHSLNVTGLQKNTAYNVQVDVHHVGTLVLSSNIRTVRTLAEEVAIFGDVNMDGVVDVADVVALANHVMGETPEQFNINVANINGDDVIDVADVVALANLIMGS